MKLIIVLFFLSLSSFCCTQSKVAPSLTDDLKSRITKGEFTAQKILLDDDYMSIHHTDAFRDIIKTNAPTEFIKISNDAEDGEKIKVRFTFKDAAGNSLPNTLIYLYHTDNKGSYGEYKNPKLFGYVNTNEEGKIEVETIRPAGYPNSGAPQHIHFEIEKYNYVSEVLFNDDKRLSEDLKKDMLSHGAYAASFDYTGKIPTIEYNITVK